MSVFNNPSIQSAFNRFDFYSFGRLVGFGMYSSLGTVYYYVMDSVYGRVYILNDQWEFISSKVFDDPCYMISIDSSLYMTGYRNV